MFFIIKLFGFMNGRVKGELPNYSYMRIMCEKDIVELFLSQLYKNSKKKLRIKKI